MRYVDVLEAEKLRRQLVSFPIDQVSDQEQFGKAVIVAAWAFCLNGDIEEALKYIDLLSLDYVKNVMPKQMDEDPAFAAMVDTVTDFLIESKVYVPFYRAPEGTVLSVLARA